MAGLERMTTGSAAKRFNLPLHTSRHLVVVSEASSSLADALIHTRIVVAHQLRLIVIGFIFAGRTRMPHICVLVGQFLRSQVSVCWLILHKRPLLLCCWDGCLCCFLLITFPVLMDGLWLDDHMSVVVVLVSSVRFLFSQCPSSVRMRPPYFLRLLAVPVSVSLSAAVRVWFLLLSKVSCTRPD